MHRIPERGVNERFLRGGGKKKKRGILFDMINGTTVLGGSTLGLLLPDSSFESYRSYRTIVPDHPAPLILYPRLFTTESGKEFRSSTSRRGSWNPSSENDD